MVLNPVVPSCFEIINDSVSPVQLKITQPTSQTLKKPLSIIGDGLQQLGSVRAVL